MIRAKNSNSNSNVIRSAHCSHLFGTYNAYPDGLLSIYFYLRAIMFQYTVPGRRSGAAGRRLLRVHGADRLRLPLTPLLRHRTTDSNSPTSRLSGRECVSVSYTLPTGIRPLGGQAAPPGLSVAAASSRRYPNARVARTRPREKLVKL